MFSLKQKRNYVIDNFYEINDFIVRCIGKLECTNGNDMKCNGCDGKSLFNSKSGAICAKERYTGKLSFPEIPLKFTEEHLKLIAEILGRYKASDVTKIHENIYMNYPKESIFSEDNSIRVKFFIKKQLYMNHTSVPCIGYSIFTDSKHHDLSTCSQLQRDIASIQLLLGDLSNVLPVNSIN